MSCLVLQTSSVRASQTAKVVSYVFFLFLISCRYNSLSLVEICDEGQQGPENLREIVQILSLLSYVVLFSASFTVHNLSRSHRLE